MQEHSSNEAGTSALIAADLPRAKRSRRESIPIFVRHAGGVVPLEDFCSRLPATEVAPPDPLDVHLTSLFGFAQTPAAALPERIAMRIDSYTYFAIGKWTGRIKIGQSNNPWRRVHELIRAANGEEATLAVVLRGSLFEGSYHDLFTVHAVGNEWFAPAPEILAEIERLSTAAGEGRA